MQDTAEVYSPNLLSKLLGFNMSSLKWLAHRDLDSLDDLHFGVHEDMMYALNAPPVPGAQWTGIVTQIAIEMLESGRVEAVVCVQSDEKDRFTPKPVTHAASSACIWTLQDGGAMPVFVREHSCRRCLNDTYHRVTKAVWCYEAVKSISTINGFVCPLVLEWVIKEGEWACVAQFVARCKEDILKAKGVKPTLSPNLKTLATVEALNVKRLLFIGVGCQVLTCPAMY